jgi:hypothetical protein
MARLEQPFYKNPAPVWIKLRVCRLLELGARPGLHGDQLWAGPLSREVATNGARLEKFATIVLLVLQ